MVCEVKFASWTEERRLRAPVFLGLRPDVDPKECVRESSTPSEANPTPAARPPLLSGKAEEAPSTAMLSKASRPALKSALPDGYAQIDSIGAP